MSDHKQISPTFYRTKSRDQTNKITDALKKKEARNSTKRNNSNNSTILAQIEHDSEHGDVNLDSPAEVRQLMKLKPARSIQRSKLFATRKNRRLRAVAKSLLNIFH